MKIVTHCNFALLMTGLLTLSQLNLASAGEGNDLLIGGDGPDILRSTSPISAVLDVDSGALVITGDDTQNIIVASLTERGEIVVNDGEVPIQGGPATLDNTWLVHIKSGPEKDLLVWDNPAGESRISQDGDDLLIWNSGDGSIFLMPIEIRELVIKTTVEDSR